MKKTIQFSLGWSGILQAMFNVNFFPGTNMSLSDTCYFLNGTCCLLVVNCIEKTMQVNEQGAVDFLQNNSQLL